MLRGIVAFEWHYHTRRITFAAAALLFAFLGFATAATGYGGPELQVNSPYSVANAVGLLSLVSVFALTLFSAQSVLRDSEHRMAEIVYTTSVTRGCYLFGRFAGSFLAAAAAFAFALPGMWIGTFLAAHDPARVGPFDLLDYLWAFAVLALPNMLFAGSLLFAVAALGRSTLATYVAGVFVYMLYLMAAMFADSPLIATSSPPTPEGLAMAAVADPFGLSAFFEQTHYWTVAERNSRRLVLGGHLLLNRLLWTGVAVLVLGLVHRLFVFRLPAGAAGEGADDAPREAADSAYRPVPVRAGRPASLWLALASTTRSELGHVLRGWPFAALVVMWLGMTWIEVVQSFSHAEFGTALLPTTGLAVGRIREPLALIGLLVVVYYSAELVWRERAAGMDEIVDATPVPNAVLLLAKSAALAALVIVLAALAVGTSATFQLASGYTRLDPGVYASLLYFVGLPVALVAVLALLLQTVAPNRWVGMLATLAAILVLHKGVGGLEHPLVRYAASPEVPYSDMNGFSPAAVSFTWFMAYWTAFAGVVAAVTTVVWRRGTDARLSRRLAGWRRWSRGARRVFLTSSLLFAATGVAVFYQTNVVNAYETTAEVYDWKADYERSYRHLETVAQPKIAHVDAALDLYPGERRYRLRGRYRLENRTDEPIDTVWVAVRRDVTRVELSLAGAPPARHDARFGMYAFVPQSPLAPGASAELAFDLAVEHRGATADGAELDVVGNGSFLLSTFVFPTVGYRFSYELESAAERRRRGLSEHARPATIEGAQAAGMGLHPDVVTFDTTVSTAADQIAVAPGTLVETWEADGRRHFHYRVDRPMMAYFGYVSARYAVERVRHRGVDVEVYYHPEHGANVGRFVAAATRSLDYFSTHFGPYPHGELRIVEIPSHWTRFAGFALPGIVYFVEYRGFLTDLSDEDRVDVVTKRVAHEVAHQWWGHQLSPDVAPGASVLVETFARYSELMVLKEMYGAEAIPPVLSYEMDRYLRGRTEGGEVPLYQVASQPWLFYSKGSVVMMAMHDLLGEDVLNGVLRELLAEALRGPRPPTSLDLLDRFYRVTREEDHVLVDQWWKEIVLYDLSVASAVAQPLPGGRCRVTVSLAAGKNVVRDGREEPLEMKEELDVAFYTAHPNAASDSEIYSGRHRIGAATEIVVEVGGCPSYVGIDPYLQRIDRNRTDNVGEVRTRTR